MIKELRNECRSRMLAFEKSFYNWTWAPAFHLWFNVFLNWKVQARNVYNFAFFCKHSFVWKQNTDQKPWFCIFIFALQVKISINYRTTAQRTSIRRKMIMFFVIAFLPKNIFWNNVRHFWVTADDNGINLYCLVNQINAHFWMFCIRAELGFCAGTRTLCKASFQMFMYAKDDLSFFNKTNYMSTQWTLSTETSQTAVSKIYLARWTNFLEIIL